MAKNTYLNNAADGSAEDLIRAITQFGCAEVHAKDLYMQARAELENGLLDVEDTEELDAHIEKLDRLERNIMTYAELRRKSTMALYKMYESEKSDRTEWCLIKHLSIGAYTSLEAWQGSDDDPELMEIAYESNKAFTEALTAFIGAEITDCAACLNEYLKSEESHVRNQE